MTLSGWLLALHLISAVALVAAMTMFTAVILACRQVDRPSVAAAYFCLVRVATVLVGVSALLVVVFGIWLAIELAAYHPWDGWIIAAIVLWVIGTVTGQQAGVRLGRAGSLASRLAASGEDGPSTELRALLRDRQASMLHLISSLAVVLILVDMIYKPGA